MFKVNNGNQKTGKSIKIINLPAGVTCKVDAPCNRKGLCYAQKGSFLYLCVKNCYAENLRTFLENPKQAEADILSQLPYYGFIRLHSSGDFLNLEYLKMICRICNKLPHVNFMGYTKKYELFNDFIKNGNKLPKNLKIIFSKWDCYNMENPYNFPVSYVKLKNGNVEAIPKNAFPCNGYCEQCYKCWTLQYGDSVVFEQH